MGKAIPFVPPEVLRSNVVRAHGKVYVSSTALDTYIRCPMLFYYSRIKKLSLVDAGTAAALVFGTAVHNAMKDVVLLRKLPDFQTYWNKHYGDPLVYSAQEADHGTLLIKGQAIINSMAAQLNELGVTGPYYTGENPTLEIQAPVALNSEVVLSRTFDALVETSNGPVLIDYKTARAMYSEGLQEEISEQMTAYSIPHNLPGVPQAEAILFLVGTKVKDPVARVFPIVRSKDRQKAFIQDTLTLVNLIENRIYYHRRMEMTCGGRYSDWACEYRPLCYGYAEKGMYKRVTR